MNTVLYIAAAAGLVIVLFAIYSKIVYKSFFNLRDDWRSFFKWWSTWLTAAGAGLGGFLIAVPDAVSTAWLAMPEEVKQRLPEDFLLYVPLGIFVAAQVVKSMKQQKPEPK